MLRSLVALALLLSLFGCRCSSKTMLPAIRMSDAALEVALAETGRVAAGDLDGDGGLEIVAVDENALRVLGPDGSTRATLPAPGAIQVLRVFDLDGDGRAKIVAGWGRSRAKLRAKAKIAIYRLSGEALEERVLLEPATERAQIVQLIPLPGSELLAAYFIGKYDVAITRLPLSDNASPTRVATLRMATSVAYGDVDGDGKPDLVIGRPYGDTQESEGDAFVLRRDGSRVPIPIVGGVSSMALADLDGDGRLEVLLGDGWNRAYVRLARALLTRAEWTGTAFDASLLHESEGEFVLWGIDTADLDGDGKPEVIVRGSERVHVLSERDGRLQSKQIGGVCEDVAVVNLDGGGADELLLLCGGRAKVYREAGSDG